MLPACASQQLKLSQLILEPQPLCHRNPHQRLPSSKHIKGRPLSPGSEKAKVSLCVCASVCLLHSKTPESFIKLILKQIDLLAVLFFSHYLYTFFIRQATICKIHEWQDSPRKRWDCMFTFGFMVAWIGWISSSTIFSISHISEDIFS